MNTIYWITRLDAILTVSLLFACILGIALLFGVFYYFFSIGDALFREEHDTSKRVIKYLSLPFIFFVLVLVFTPSTKEAIAIYGCGRILEYVESNEKITSMPDRVVDITDKYFDKLSKELEDQQEGE